MKRIRMGRRKEGRKGGAWNGGKKEGPIQQSDKHQ